MSNDVSSNKNDSVLSTKNGRWRVFLNLFVLVGVVSGFAELVGTKKISLGSVGNIILLPMIFAMVIIVLFTPDALGKKIEALQKICSEKEEKLSEEVMMLVLLILGTKLGSSAGPNIMKIIEAGPALILQEFGNLGTMFLGLPIALLLGMRREAVGATVSICREPSLGLIGEVYGMNSPEGLGVMGTYMVGNLFGTIFYGILATLAVSTGIHPYALAMACGMGSGSMMTASSQALAAAVPEMSEEILAFAATSNILSNIDGLYMELFIALPLANKLYNLFVSRKEKKGVAM